MLVLSRKAQEVIVIGKDVEVCVVKIQGDKVRLGIKAPRDVSVIRQEIVLRGEREPEAKA
ncbi:MAG: carbon storage regulator CsrA [Elusimicrobia bacterium]|nr:carbon storage regulator CsrA [Elusimicrobiota bacterium]